MFDSSALLLIAAVAAVGVLHTVVPDHWVPITLIARRNGWSKAETARASLQAGTGHVLSTLLVALVVWAAGVAVADRFGHFVDTAASLALIAFGGWVALSAWPDLRRGSNRDRHTHRHDQRHGLDHLTPDAEEIHGPEFQRINTEHGAIGVSIYEIGTPPRFRLTAAHAHAVKAETLRLGDARQVFTFVNRGEYWESVDEIPEPHEFELLLTVVHDGHEHTYWTDFAEHEQHGHAHHQAYVGEGAYSSPDGDELYAPLAAAVAVRHRHVHRHGQSAPPHGHWHDHVAADAHPTSQATEFDAPLHQHRHKTRGRTALLLILGSSPMVEGIPAFFAAQRYGIGFLVVMAIVFGVSTIGTYVLLCVYSTAGLQRVRLGPAERYGEVLSGAFIAGVGLVFWIWPAI